MRSSQRLPATWYALAAGIVLAAAALGLWAWRFNHRLRLELSRAARAQSEVLARDFGEEFQTQHLLASERIFEPFSQESHWPPEAMDTVLARALRAEQCRCGPAYRARGAFQWSSRQPGQLHTRNIPAEQIDGLLHEVAARAAPLPSLGSATLLIKSDAVGRERFGLGVFQRLPDGSLQALGFEGDAAEPWNDFIQPIVEKVGRARLGPRHAELIAWAVVRPSGDTLFATGAFDPTHPAVRNRFWRRQFVADSFPQALSFISEPASAPHAPGPTDPDPRATPWLVAAQVSPAALATLLYGSEWVGSAVILGVVGLAAVLAAAVIAVARDLVRHVAEREAFASAVAHDLRTPLTQILLHAESLQLGRAAEGTRRDAARVIAREARRLVHLVENAMTFVRRKDAPPRLHFAVVDPAQLLQQVLTTFEPTATRADMQLRADLTSHLAVNLDAEAFTQVLLNLLENAVRFGARGQVISVTSRAHGTELVIDVSDEGQGIPTDEREQIFHPFVRGQASGGTGIGLAVARQLVELMNGRIAAREPASGRGACLEIRFPLAPMPPSASPPDAPARPPRHLTRV